MSGSFEPSLRDAIKISTKPTTTIKLLSSKSEVKFQAFLSINALEFPNEKSSQEPDPRKGIGL
jgi:hypothetical protein